MPKKKRTSPIELSDAVDIPTLKDLLTQSGCVLPQGFEIELEKHLRILMARYIPIETKESFASTREMGKVMRSLFTGDTYSIGNGYLLTEDKNAIRVWDKEFFDKQKGLGLSVPQHLRDHLLSLSKLRTTKPGFTIEKSLITDLIPKTIQHRKGHHKYVLFSFGRKGVIINNSKSGDSLQSEVCVLSDALATNLLPIKDQTITVRLLRNKGKKNLLVTSRQFEIFFK